MRKRNGNLGSLVCSNTQSPLGAGPASAHPSRSSSARSSLMASEPNDRASPLGRRGRELTRHTRPTIPPTETRQNGRFCREFGSNGPAHPRLTSSTRIRDGTDLPNKWFQHGREIGPIDTSDLEMTTSAVASLSVAEAAELL